MAFDGWLLKLGNDKFPHKWIYKESYKVTPNRRQDLDPTRDEEGYLHRNTVSHDVSTISFSTKPMWNNDMADCMSFLRNHYTNSKEKKVNATYYCPDTDSYKTGEFYVPDIEFNMDLVNESEKRILYLGTTLEFIEY